MYIIKRDSSYYAGLSQFSGRLQPEYSLISDEGETVIIYPTKEEAENIVKQLEEVFGIHHNEILKIGEIE